MAQIVGIFRLGRDAELRHTAGGDHVSSLNLAFNYGQKGEDGNKPTQWIEASLWGKRAEAMSPHLLKGGLIYAVISDPHIETYQGKNGEGHKLTGRIAEIEFAGGTRSESTGERQASSSKPAGGGASKKPSIDDDSSIPF